MFQRRHFELLANWIKTELKPNDPVIKWISHSLANKLEDNSPRFDREQFLTACGIAKDEQWPRS